MTRGPDQKNLVPLTQADLDDAIRKHMMFSKGRVGGARAILAYRKLSGLHFRGAFLDGADFTGAQMEDTDLRGAHLDGAVFFACRMPRASFCKASLVRADLRGACARGADFTDADLSAADLREGAVATKDRRGNISALSAQGLPLNAATDAQEAIFLRARLHKALLRGADLRGAILEKADCTLAQMQGVKLEKAVLLHTRLEGVELSEAEMTDVFGSKCRGLSLADAFTPLEALLEKHVAWVKSHGAEGARLDFTHHDLVPRDGSAAPDFRDCHLAMMKAHRAMFYRLRFSGAELQTAELRECDFRLAALDRCDLRGADFSDSILMHANLQLSECAPLLLPGGRQIRTNFSHCNLRYANFAAADLRAVSFAGADLSFSDLRGARLEGALFEGVRLEGTLSDGPLAR